MLGNIHYGKKIKATIVEDFKVQLGLQMIFKRKKMFKVENSKENREKFTLPSWIAAIA